VSIKCGRCREYHPTIADVRKCFNGQTAATEVHAKPAKPLSASQVNYVGNLLKQLNAEYTGQTPVEALDRHGAGRKLLDGLVSAREAKAHGESYKLPQDVSQSAKPVDDSGERTVTKGKFNPTEVEKGYYATPSKTGNNDLDFWFVNVVTREGKWQGWRTVSRVIGGHANTKVFKAERRLALEKIIDFGIERAGNVFADELGQCKKCGKHLTDETSRQRRMGPDCYARYAA